MTGIEPTEGSAEILGQRLAAEQRPAPDRPLSLSRRVASVLSASGFSSAVTMLLTMATAVAVARQEGPRGYAQYVAANMVIFVTATLVECGVTVALAKHVARREAEHDHEEVRSLATMVIRLFSLLAFAVGLGMAFFVPAIEDALHISFGAGFAIALAPTLALTLTWYCAHAVFVGLLRPYPTIMLTLTGPTFTFAYIVIRRYVYPLPLWGAVVVTYVASGLLAILLLARADLFKAQPKLRSLLPIVRDLPSGAAFTFFVMFSGWSDRFIVASRLGPQFMGLYAAAVAVIQAALRMPSSLARTLVSASAKAGVKGEETRSRLVAETIQAFGFFLGPIIVIAALLSRQILLIFFGPGFAPAADVLRLMLPGLAAGAIIVPAISALTGSERAGRVATLLVGSVPIRIFLIFWLTGRLGLSGAAIAMSLTDVLLAAACLWAGRRAGLSVPARAFLRPAALTIAALTAGVILMSFIPTPVAAILALSIFVPDIWIVGRRIRAMYA
jgi:O-antigen/teichoic acid export membrane protein